MRTWLAANSSALIQGLVGLGIGAATVIGTVVAVHATLQQQKTTSVAAKRAQVYQSFLDSANTYASEVTIFLRTCGPAGDANPTCPAKTVSDAQTSRYNFQGAINDVYVYGSNNAFKAESAVAAALPPSLIPYSAEPTASSPDFTSFSSAFRAFAKVMCDEVGTAKEHC